MAPRSPHLDRVAAHRLRPAFDKIRADLDISVSFPAEVEEAAVRAAGSAVLPDVDRTDLELVTIDPVGSMDLDQAMHIARDGDGYLVSYAIADVGAFVQSGHGPLDVEARRRGQTYYAPDRHAPLYPTSLSEGAASLLPGELRPALLWTLHLDSHGRLCSTELVRARVRSRERLDYAGVQADLDAGIAAEPLRLLVEVGRLREQIEVARGGVSLPMPEQEVESADGDTFELRLRTPLEVEGYNAQISLLTGIAAANLMIEGRVGLLRTLPAADDHALDRLHRVAAAVGIDWPADAPYAAFIHSLDPAHHRDLAVITAATAVFRGAGYVAFDGEVPTHAEHAALATPYAHVTAPLRRLADRYTAHICLALAAGTPPPSDVRASLSDLAKILEGSDRRAHSFEGACLDATEAAVLQHRIGVDFTGTVVAVDRPRKGGRSTSGEADPSSDTAVDQRGDLWVDEPPVIASITGRMLPLGERVTARLEAADPSTRTVRFALGS